MTSTSYGLNDMAISLPKIHIGSHTLSNASDALKKEWLVTNGLGGYASSTVLGINTRKYHGPPHRFFQSSH